jgi:hypothetical protein
MNWETAPPSWRAETDFERSQTLVSQTPITVGPAVHGRPVGLPEDPHDPIVSEPNLNCGCVSDQVAARPINLGSVQCLQRFADLHQLHVDALLRVLRAQEDLAGAVWDTLRAWRGRGSERPFAVNLPDAAGQRRSG